MPCRFAHCRHFRRLPAIIARCHAADIACMLLSPLPAAYERRCLIALYVFHCLIIADAMLAPYAGLAIY